MDPDTAADADAAAVADAWCVNTLTLKLPIQTFLSVAP